MMELQNMETAVADDTNLANTTEPILDQPVKVILDRKAILYLCIQHLSSSWGQRSFEFASYLFLITLFPGNLLLPSIFGFVTTLAAIIGAGWIGGLVDRNQRLRFVRICIVTQKATVAFSYSMFLILFLQLRSNASSDSKSWIVYLLFSFITTLSAILGLSTIAISVSIERDWVTAISQGDGDNLTLLNTYLRRIDLLSKLLAPLFVSLLTTAVSYPFTVAFLLGLSLITMITEFFWINVVFDRLPILAIEEKPRLDASIALKAQSSTSFNFSSIKPGLRRAGGDWKEFYESKVFPSSVSIALLYLMTLSFDGAMLSYLKTHIYSDLFLAGMRGVGVITGLMGTVVMPILEKKVGIVRTGTYSIVFELVWLIPVLVSFYVGAPADGERGSSANSAILFTGMAISRIGLWSFDLAQLKVLQTTLQNHPRRNSLTALQYSLCNIFDLLKYVLTIVLAKPSQFKYAALTSVISVILATASWLYYSRQERGHLIHFDKLLLRKRTS